MTIVLSHLVQIAVQLAFVVQIGNGNSAAIFQWLAQL